jgi:hypothetical protein
MKFIVWIACALVSFGVNRISKLGVLIYFSVENMIMVQEALSFYFCVVLPPV